MMFPGPFTELYAAARVDDLGKHRVHTEPTCRREPSVWKQRVARTLVHLALELDAEQVRVERAAATA